MISSQKAKFLYRSEFIIESIKMETRHATDTRNERSQGGTVTAREQDTSEEDSPTGDNNDERSGGSENGNNDDPDIRDRWAKDMTDRRLRERERQKTETRRKGKRSTRDLINTGTNKR